MIIINLKDLVAVAPELLTLLLPGFVFMSIFMWIKNIKIEISAITLWSLFISILIKSLCVTLHTIIFKYWNFPESTKIIIYTIIGFILPFIIHAILSLSLSNKLLNRFVRKTINDDLLDDLIDYNDPTMVRVYMKNSNILYVGKVCMREENGLDSRIAIVDYGVLEKDTLKEIYDSATHDKQTVAIICLRDVERLETIYSSNSNVWKMLHPY